MLLSSPPDAESLQPRLHVIDGRVVRHQCMHRESTPVVEDPQQIGYGSGRVWLAADCCRQVAENGGILVKPRLGRIGLAIPRECLGTKPPRHQGVLGWLLWRSRFGGQSTVMQMVRVSGQRVFGS